MESPIIVLFRQWEAIYAKAVRPKSDEEGDRFCAELHLIEKQMLAMSSTSAADFAAKMIAFTGYGDFSLQDDCGSVIMDEAKALTQSQPAQIAA